MVNQTVLVTGGTGYLASWIVKGLLEKGYDVRITVRNKADVKKYEHLLHIEKATEGHLSVYEADLLKDGSFNEAAQGCDVVFHTASPFFIAGIKDAKKDLIEPAKKGTQNVLNAVNRARTVRRVVLTSSVAAIYSDNCELKGKTAFTEADWNETSSPSHQPYSFSKTVAEKEAWEMCKKQDKWDLVTINPSFLLGPSLTTRKDSTSISTIVDFLSGKYKSGVPDFSTGYVDVRDVAKAEIAAAFTEDASGRYVLSAGEASLAQIAATLEKCFPGQYPLPRRVVPKFLFWLIAPLFGYSRKVVSRNAGYPLRFNNGKSVGELGMSYKNLEKTLTDQKEQLERDKII
ncbi:aldehyde reductase [Sporolactobacillus shoreae]|uniref:Aldehyde reductase n=1 Tax=Sporolactobacillus shoreae TaxID=1465501 RepID=A0A4Z0GNR5_9BACL|nr:aldehyde reductase [Sporolactobacillus shoreae]TGA97618.1 aldehyde reductase [Sporolactobacillus shoreae]